MSRYGERGGEREESERERQIDTQIARKTDRQKTDI